MSDPYDWKSYDTEILKPGQGRTSHSVREDALVISLALLGIVIVLAVCLLLS